MHANSGDPLPLIATAVLHPADASRSTTLQAASATLARTVLLVVLALTGILILLPAALDAVGTQALAAT